MSVLSVKAGVFSPHRIRGTVRNVQEAVTDIELRRGELWRADGDNCWRMIVCQGGVIWVTQERDLKDYVLKEGEMFIVTLPGSVLVQALEDALVQITPPLKATPYVGEYVFFS